MMGIDIYLVQVCVVEMFMGGVIMKFCSQCGTQLSDDAVFCSGCGARVGEAGGVSANTTATVGENKEQSTFGENVSANGGQDLKEIASNVVNNLTGTVNQAINSEKGQEYLANSSKLSNIGYVAAVLGAVSVFFPIFSFGGLGGTGTSAMQESTLIGLLIIAVSLFGAYGVNIRKYAMTLASGQALLVLSLLGFAVYNSQLKNNFWGRMIGYDLGIYLPLVAGIVMVLLAGFLSLAARQIKPDIGGVLSEIKAMELGTVEINGLRINVVVLTILLLAIVFLGAALS